MKKVTPLSKRKTDHIKINLEQNVSSSRNTGLEQYTFTHEALPELNLKDVETTQILFNSTINAPILISSMTGGTEDAKLINQRLAEVAQEFNIPMGVGSQRVALEDSKAIKSFSIAREVAPDILLFANIGAVQLNKGYTVEHCQRAIDMIDANALILHLNPLQEAVQSGGDTEFAGLAMNIEKVCRSINVPVIVKEVGWGISKRTASLLKECGVAVIDVAGAGGTSWSQVEMHRAPDEFTRNLAATYINWGIPTADSILNVKETTPEMIIFASGGLNSGNDIAKCIALGASLGGMAGNLLKAAAISSDRIRELIRLTIAQLQVTMFCTGHQTLYSLCGSLDFTNPKI